MKKQRIFLVAVLICCLALAGGGTYAFFTAQETAYNVITTGELEMELVEMHGDIPWSEIESVDGVMPGDEISKRVTVQNLGGVDFYTRVKVTGVIIKEGENAEPEVLDMDKLDKVEIDFDTENWTLGEDGYYYYNRALPASTDKTATETEPLFTTVTLNKDLGNAYQNARIEIVVDAQAVQSRNNTDSPLTAAGWEE